MTRDVIRTLALPLLLVAVLAATLGFFVTRVVAGDSRGDEARVSVVAIPSTPTPSPSPSPTPTPQTSGRTTRTDRDPRCPRGCECTFRPGGSAIVCEGTSLNFP